MNEYMYAECRLSQAVTVAGTYNSDGLQVYGWTHHMALKFAEI